MDQKEQIIALARKFAEIFNEYPQVIPYVKDLQLKFDSFIEDEVCTVSMGATDVYIGTNPMIITKDLFISPGKFIDAFIEEYTLKYDVLCDNLEHYIEKAHEDKIKDLENQIYIARVKREESIERLSQQKHLVA